MDDMTLLSDTIDGAPMNEARRMIEHAIRQSEQRTLDLKTKLNMYTPIARLPEEILLQIFVKLAEGPVDIRSDSMFCVPVTHVCRQWRIIALGYPTLWTMLQCTNHQWTLIMLERSIAAPLMVYPAKPAFDTLTAVLQHLHRFKCFKILLWDPSDLEKVQALIRSLPSNAAPQLEELSLSCPFEQETWCFSPTTFQRTHYLRNLNLANIDIDWSLSPLPLGLTHLTIQLMSVLLRPTWKQLVISLGQLPALRRLHLEEMLPIIPLNGTTDVAYLPNLESITFSYTDFDTVAIFLKLVKLPAKLKIFTVVDIDNDPNPEQYNTFFRAIRNSMTNLCSRVTSMKLERVSDIFEPTVRGKLSVEFWADSELDLPNLDLELPYSPEAERDTIVINAFRILCLANITHLRIGEGVKHMELLTSLERLPRLQAIQVFERATNYLVKALNDLQICSTVGAMPLPELSEIRISRDYDTRYPSNCVFDVGLWHDLQTFLKQRHACEVQIQRLCIENCCYIREEMVDRLKQYVGEFKWDNTLGY